MFPALPQRFVRQRDREREAYRSERYNGLPSCPLFLASSEEWDPVYPAPQKTIMPLVSCTLAEKWEQTIVPEFILLLDGEDIQWSSLDPVSMVTMDNSTPPTKMIWVGIRPRTMSYDESNTTARSLKDILVNHQILDVVVELRESSVFVMDPNVLLKPFSPYCVTVINPFTSTMLKIPTEQASKDTGETMKQDDKVSMPVIKDKSKGKVAFSGLRSAVRHTMWFSSDQVKEKKVLMDFLEIAVYSIDEKDSSFIEGSDFVVDGEGNLIGMLTAGAGIKDDGISGKKVDITYIQFMDAYKKKLGLQSNFIPKASDNIEVRS